MEKQLIELIKNASSGFIVKTADGKYLPIANGVKGEVIEPAVAIKQLLFGGSADADQLTKELIFALGGKIRVGRKASTTGTKRGPKPKSATV
tara:strand:- start:127 stop:402 length:276 start_codon:yes stop_codon:yes gene_type:complete